MIALDRAQCRPTDMVSVGKLKEDAWEAIDFGWISG